MASRSGLDHLCQAEVENLCVPALGNENVGRFDIAMDDPFAMGRIQRVSDLDGERENHLRLHRPVGNAMLQRHTVEILHDDERSTFLLINLMDGADVWVIERGRGLGFLLKASECLRVFGYIVGKEFEGDKAAELNVVGL